MLGTQQTEADHHGKRSVMNLECSLVGVSSIKYLHCTECPAEGITCSCSAQTSVFSHTVTVVTWKTDIIISPGSQGVLDMVSELLMIWPLTYTWVLNTCM